MILFLRLIVYDLGIDLGIPQQAASIIYEDNNGCTAMANAQKPTTRTRHMDIKYFSLSEWVERDLMILERVNLPLTQQITSPKFSIEHYSTDTSIYHETHPTSIFTMS